MNNKISFFWVFKPSVFDNTYSLVLGQFRTRQDKKFDLEIFIEFFKHFNLNQHGNKSDDAVFDQETAVSNFRLFGIVIGIFDIVVGGLGNFFTILAFTR